MEKRLNDLKWTPQWTSIIGCYHGCSKYLCFDMSVSWISGGSGHAFIMNIDPKGLCPSGPTAFKNWVINANIGRLGMMTTPVGSTKDFPRFPAKQKEAWELAKESLNYDVPVIAWEVYVPEFYVVNGYDDNGYFASGALDEKLTKSVPWDKLGTTDIGWLWLASVSKEEPKPDIEILKGVIDFTLKFATTRDYLHDNYVSGLEAYDGWINALSSKEAVYNGASYNAAVWAECRYHAGKFLSEMKTKLPGMADPEFDELIKLYGKIAEDLKTVSEIFPFEMKTDKITDDSKINRAIDALKSAKENEKNALKTLVKIEQKLI